MAITSGPRSTFTAAGSTVELARVPLAKIDRRPGQPRQDAAGSAIEELAPSVAQYDVVQPVVLRRVEGGRYELVAGERRFLAAQAAGRETIPASIRYLTDDQAAELALIENVCRRDLNPIEKARAIKQLATAAKGRTQADVARLCGKADCWAQNLTRLLRLPQAWQELIAAEEVPESCGRLLLPYLDAADGQTILEAVLLDRQARPEAYLTRAAFERSAKVIAARVRGQEPESRGQRAEVRAPLSPERATADHAEDADSTTPQPGESTTPAMEGSTTAGVGESASPHHSPAPDLADPEADERTAGLAELPEDLAEAFAGDHSPAARPQHRHPLTTDVIAERICRLIRQLDDVGQLDLIGQALAARRQELEPRKSPRRRKRAG